MGRSGLAGLLGTALFLVGFSAEAAAPSCGAASGNVNLTVVDDIDGNILDVDDTRILFNGALGISLKNRADGVVTLLSNDTPTSAYLFSLGAAWATGTWRSGVLTARSEANECTALCGNGGFQVSGDWAIWKSKLTTAVRREDLLTGTVTDIGTMGQFDWIVSISPDGNAAYENRLSNGAEVHTVTPAGVNSVVPIAYHPLISGDLLVHTKHSIGVVRMPIYGAGETLDPYAGSAPPYEAAPGRDYLASGGWIAYTKYVAGQMQGWTRSPAGVKAMATPYPYVQLVAVNAIGEIVVDRWNGGSGRSISALGQAPVDITGGGTPRWFGGAWYTTGGCYLYKVQGGAPPPPPVEDAGADGGADAGEDSGLDAAADAGVTTDGGSSSGGSSSGAAPSPDRPEDPTAPSCGASRGAASSTGAGLAVFVAALAFSRRRRRA